MYYLQGEQHASFLKTQKPCEAVVYGFFFLYQCCNELRYDIKGTTVQILKACVAIPWLKASKRYYSAVLYIFLCLL
jgi:hypothetical protein